MRAIIGTPLMALRRRLHAQGGADDGQGGGGGDAQGGGGDEAHGAAFWEREAVWEGDGDVDTAGGSAGAPGGVAVVLTGATGFLGPHLLAALAAHPTLSSATIYCLVRPPVSRVRVPAAAARRVVLLEADLGAEVYPNPNPNPHPHPNPNPSPTPTPTPSPNPNPEP